MNNELTILKGKVNQNLITKSLLMLSKSHYPFPMGEIVPSRTDTVVERTDTPPLIV